MTAMVRDLLAELGPATDFAHAPCVGRWRWFDPPGEHEAAVSVRERHEAAVHLCGTCPLPTFARCAATARSLPKAHRRGVWEALIAVADLAGGDWPKRARVAAVAQVADSMAGAPSIGVQLLTDLKAVFKGQASMWAESILEALHAMDERPWNDLRGKPVDNRWLARQLKKYGVASKDVKLDGTNKKGYTAEDLFDPWTRYVADVAGALWKLGDDDEDSTNSAVGVAAQESATSATRATDTPAQCSVCAQPFLLPLPGKTVCARRDPDHDAARAVA